MPLCASISFLVMLKPNPVPPNLRVAVMSPCEHIACSLVLLTQRGTGPNKVRVRGGGDGGGGGGAVL